MNPPSAESVWATVAAHSACVCDEAVYGDLPCLVHNRLAAEVWIVAKGLVCTHTHRIRRRLGNEGTLTEYDFLWADLGTLEVGEVMQLVNWYGLPLSVRLYGGRWYPRRGWASFPKLEDVLIYTGNFR